jgi:uncharacterized phage protein (TIGR01671 family)
MRALKFRAWYDGLMYEVYSIRWNNATIRPGVKEDVAISQIDMINKDARALYHTDGLDKIKLMQFTELFDKNGKEIYDGDVVRKPYSGLGSSSPYAVEWGQLSNGDWETECYGWLLYDAPNEVEVIGNVYEHPELIEGQPHV